MTVGKRIGNALREAGYRVVHRYQNPRSKGFQKVIEVGKLNTQKAWQDMSKEKEAVMKIVQSIVPEAEFKYYRGWSHWVIRIAWFEERLMEPTRTAGGFRSYRLRR